MNVCVCVFMQSVISGTSHIKESITIAIAHPMCYYFWLGICGMVLNKTTFRVLLLVAEKNLTIVQVQ